MISIITAIRNQFSMNQLFIEAIQRYTHQPYELIIIDNQSTDGSGDYFRSQGATVIRNEANYSYPYCQNQGLAVAGGDIIAFLNNDLIVAPDWDVTLRHLMETQSIDFLSPASNDRSETEHATKRLRRQWKRIKYPLLYVLGNRKFSLALMHRLMYSSWAAFQLRRYTQFGLQTIEGFSGSCILATRSGLEKIGFYWDKRIQEADFDLFYRTKQRAVSVGDIKPVQVALGIYFHHFSRLTLRSRDYIPFADSDVLIPLERKWGKDPEARIHQRFAKTV